MIEFDQCHTISQSVTILEVPPKGSRTAMPLSKEGDAARKREQREARSAEAAARSAVTQKKLAKKLADEAAAFVAAIARVPLEEEAALAATLPLSKIADAARKRKERGEKAPQNYAVTQKKLADEAAAFAAAIARTTSTHSSLIVARLRRL